MSEDEKTEKFNTSCSPCIFAQWEEGVQKDDGCDLGRLEKYKDTNRVHTHEDGYFIIDTICNACRGESWANHNLGRNLIAKVEEEIQIKLAFILLSMDDDAERIVKGLPELVKKCISQEQIKPQQIIVVIKNNIVSYNQLFNILSDECDNIEFKLIKVIEPEADLYRCIDLAVQKCYSRYYAIFNLNSNIPKNLIKTINNVINYELKPLSMVTPYCGMNGLIIQTALHRIFGGNKEFPIYDKIVEASKMQGSENQIYTWETLWNNRE